MIFTQDHREIALIVAIGAVALDVTVFLAWLTTDLLNW